MGKKEKKKLRKEKKKEKKKIKKEEKKAPKARGRGCPMCKKCSPKRKSFKVGDKKYLYVKFKKKYLGCRVKSAFAVKNYDRVKQLASKYKKQKWLCYNKLMKKKFGGGGGGSGGPKPGNSKGKRQGKKFA